MTPDDTALMQALPVWAFAFVLVLSRVSAVVLLLPGIGESEPPAMLRAGLTLGMTLLLLPVVAPLVPAAPGDVWRDLLMVGAELLAGGLLGWLARLLVLALPMAGNVISYMIGLSSVLQPDPQLGQTTVLAKALGLAATVLVLSTGLYALPIAALAGSYRLVAPGHLLPMADTTQEAVAAVAQGFALAMQLAAPLVFAGTLWQLGLALCARLVPNLQIYVAAVPGQIAGGLLLLSLLLVGIVSAWGEAVRAGFMLLPGH
jgi:flagellar biosynthetic protein FliR